MTASDRLTSGPIDPDLEAVLPRLARDAIRLRQLEQQTADYEQPYSTLLPRKTERADIADMFTTTARRLNIGRDHPGRALLLIVERADDLYRARRRRPSLAQVLQSLVDATPAAERDREATATEAKMAAGAAREAAWHADALAGARQYLEACRS